MVKRIYTIDRGIQIPIDDEEVIDLDTINSDTYERYIARQNALLKEKKAKTDEKTLQILRNQQANVLIAEQRFRQMIQAGEAKATAIKVQTRSIGGRGSVLSNLASVARNTGMFGSTMSQNDVRGAAAQVLASIPMSSGGSGAATSAARGYSAPGGAQESSALYAAPGISIIPVSEGTQGYTTVQTPEGPAVLGEGWAKGSQYMNTQNAYLYSGNSYSFIDASTVSHGTVSGPSVEYASGNLSGVMANSP